MLILKFVILFFDIEQKLLLLEGVRRVIQILGHKILNRFFVYEFRR